MDYLVLIVLLVAGYAALFVLERAFPLRVAKAPLLQRVWVNAAVSATAFIAAALAVRPSAQATLGWTSAEAFGVVPWLGLSGIAAFVVTFLLLDLTFYLWHIANHRVPVLWRIHNVHHIDPDLDVTTSFRFHFAEEVALSAVFRAAQIALIGPSLLAFVVYEIVFQLATQFHHSNLRLPATFERFLVYFLVTPRMHGIHHSTIRSETNSNYGVVFPWWDRLLGTLRLDVPQQQVVIGVPGYSTPGDNRIWNCLRLPFIRQRAYWDKASQRRPRNQASALMSARRLRP